MFKRQRTGFENCRRSGEGTGGKSAAGHERTAGTIAGLQAL